MAEPKLDIFRALGAADRKDHAFLTDLTPEEVKGYQPFLVMRWLTGTSSASQVYVINEVVNPYAFNLSQHKQLMWDLTIAATDGKQRRYGWIKAPSRTLASKPVAIKVLRETYGYSVKHAEEAFLALQHTPNAIVKLAEAIGLQKEEMTKLKKELAGTSDTSKEK